MFVKRYIANDMSEAMEKIRKELGSEAVILSHRTMRKKGMSGLLKKKLVEVMVAYEPAQDRFIGVESQPVQTVAEPALMPEKQVQTQPAVIMRPMVAAQANAPQQAVSQDAVQQAVSQGTAQQTIVQAAVSQQAFEPQYVADEHTASQHTSPQPQAVPPQAVPQQAVPQQAAPQQTAPRHIPHPPIVVQASDQAGQQQLRGIMQYQQAAAQVRYVSAQAAPSQAAPSQAAPLQAAPSQTASSQVTPVSFPVVTAASVSGSTEQTDSAFETLDFPRLTQLKDKPEEPEEDARIDELSTKLAELKTVVRSLTAKIITVDKESLLQFSPEVMRLYNTFLEQDIQEELARSLCDKIQEVAERTGESPEGIAEEQLLSLLGCPASIKVSHESRTVIMLAGPSGVGKTTTLVKLAGMFTLKEGVKVGFINTDTYRVAAQEQLKVYADIMGIPCCTVYAPDEIPMALSLLSDCEVVLIDTAGKSVADRLYQEELSAFIQQSGANEVLLHISASMSVAACQELIQYFSFMDAYRLVITKLDEVSAWGNIVNIVAYAKKPMAFITIGQKVPQDIEVPDVMHITRRILGSVGV